MCYNLGMETNTPEPVKVGDRFCWMTGAATWTVTEIHGSAVLLTSEAHPYGEPLVETVAWLQAHPEWRVK